MLHWLIAFGLAVGSGVVYADDANADDANADDATTGDANTDPPHRSADEGTEIVEDADTHWLLGLGLLIGTPLENDFDRALATRAYGDPSPTYGADLGALYRVTRGFSVGLRTAVRHRYWLHYNQPAATLFSVDLLANLDLRHTFRHRAQIGFQLAGGFAVVSTRLGGESVRDLGGRVQLGPLATFPIVGTLRILVRIAYDFHRLSIVGETADLGGATFLLGFEVRE
ncbi:MAG: hypothetical protein AAGE52_04205 [Myxococcota bacterium]